MAWVDPPEIASLSSVTLASTFSLTGPGTLSPSSLSCFLVWYNTESAWFFASMASLFSLSSFANFSASLTILSTCSFLFYFLFFYFVHPKMGFRNINKIGLYVVIIASTITSSRTSFYHG
ncbi:hypothetical protein ACB098_11G182700 [Castanea mollissima]